MKNDKIELTDSTMDVIMKMSQGNPGAITVIGNLLKDDPVKGIMTVLSLDDMGMRGPQIWIAFKDHCKGDIEKLKEAVKKRDRDMVATVNREFPDRKAVPGGASFA